MSRNRFAAKIDVNQPEMVKTLRSIDGVTVELNHDDILVGYKGRTYWFEIKDPNKLFKKDGSFAKGQIKPSQQKILDEWHGHYRIVWEMDMILEDIGIKAKSL